MKNVTRSLLFSFLLCAVLVASAACNRDKSQSGAATNDASAQGAKRYTFKGKIMSVDKNAGTANIDNEPIAGFMDKMVMSYSFKPPSQINQLQSGDSITADVVVDSGQYWLENVKVAGH